MRLRKLGSFDFNSRFYADDDLIVGAADPFQLFRIMFELLDAGGLAPDSGVALMLDQCHNVEAKIPGQIRSVLNVQEMAARAASVDTDALTAAQEACDVLGANDILMDAFYTDVRPRLADWRDTARPARKSDARIRRVRLPGPDRRRTRRWHPIRLGRLTPPDNTRPSKIDDIRTVMTHPAVTALIARSNRLGADPKNTNYAGGNTSAKGSDTDPATGEPIDLMWVKGSGGDLGTLTEQGLAVLRLDRMRALVDVYPGPDREDEMVGLFDYTLHGRGGAAPSIDTAMHGLVDADHVDHLHPDSGIAIATAADGEALTKQIYGDRVVWIPWRRPGFQLGLDIADVQKRNPQAIGTILGGHGITAWGNTSEEAEANSLEIIAAAERYIDQNGRPQPFGPPIAGYQPLEPGERRAKAAALAPFLRGLASTDNAQVGHFTDTPAVLDFLAATEHPRLAALGTSCPDHFLRTKVKPLVLDLPADAGVEDSKTRLAELHAQYREDYRAYYERHADRRIAGDARRRSRPSC